ncbi:MAG: DUF456 domain-containing protein [Betaproteobacteria bacterium]
MTDVLLWITAAGLVITGLAGTLLPLLPGVPLVFLGLLLGAWIDGFAKVGLWPLLLCGALAAVALAVDFFASVEGARRFGAGRLALIGAGAWLAPGLFFGLPGMVVGPFAGAALGQIAGGGSVKSAGRAGLGTLAGLVLGSAAKFVLSLAMVVVFAAALVS